LSTPSGKQVWLESATEIVLAALRGGLAPTASARHTEETQ
jgi:hypothetical protein